MEVATAGDDFVTQDCVEHLDLDEINLRPYEQYIAVYMDFEREMLSLMCTNSYEKRVPSMTPVAFNRELAQKKES